MIPSRTKRRMRNAPASAVAASRCSTRSQARPQSDRMTTRISTMPASPTIPIRPKASVTEAISWVATSQIARTRPSTVPRTGRYRRTCLTAPVRAGGGATTRRVTGTTLWNGRAPRATILFCSAGTASGSKSATQIDPGSALKRHWGRNREIASFGPAGGRIDRIEGLLGITLGINQHDAVAREAEGGRHRHETASGRGRGSPWTPRGSSRRGRAFSPPA